MKKKTTLIYILALLCILFITDRYLWMPERVKEVWTWESGIGLGDPIAYKQNFILNGSEITFVNFKDKEHWSKVYKNTQSKFYFAGCYFGTLYIYDTQKGKIAIYIND
jgi:hypothetical protein